MPPDQSYFDARSEEELRRISVQHRNNPMGDQARLALSKKSESAAELAAAERHRESIAESRASRRLDKWALTVAVIALLVGGAGLWRSFLPSEPARLSPALASSVLADHADPIPVTKPKISTPATKPPLPPSAPKPDEKSKALPQTQKE